MVWAVQGARATPSAPVPIRSLRSDGGISRHGLGGILPSLGQPTTWPGNLAASAALSLHRLSSYYWAIGAVDQNEATTFGLKNTFSRKKSTGQDVGVRPRRRARRTGGGALNEVGTGAETRTVCTAMQGHEKNSLCREECGGRGRTATGPATGRRGGRRASTRAPAAIAGLVAGLEGAAVGPAPRGRQTCPNRGRRRRRPNQGRTRAATAASILEDAKR